MDNIDVSVIIVSWNTRDLLRNCLNSVYQTVTGVRYEIIVADNASSDGTVAMLTEEFPAVVRIVNRENRGFGAANNQALHVMKGKYALLLNSDAVLTDGAVRKLWEFCEAHEQAGIVCGQLLNADGSKQNSIAAFPSLLTLAVNNALLEFLFPGAYPSKRYEHRQPLEVDSAIGACMMIRKKALDITGLFDERYFFFFEETDLARTMRDRGWKIYQVPNARIYHLQGQSVGHNTGARVEFYRSRYQYLHKWHGRRYVILAKSIIFLRLGINFCSNLALVLLTLGMNDKFRRQWITYAELIRWHFRKDISP